MGKKTYNPFSVRNVEDDAEKDRFNWGVQSLPWLILSDSNHLVRAAGFSMNELDVKLKRINGD